MDDIPAPSRLTLWAATVHQLPLEGRLAAAQAGGFTAQSVFTPDLAAWLAEGQTLAGIREQARAAGVPITALDSLVQWLPNWQQPAGVSPQEQAFLDVDETTILQYAADLQVDKISVIAAFGPACGVAELVTAFQRICDKAREQQLRVQVEFMPFGSIPDLATGWEVVRRADRENGGLVFDTWHYYRSGPDDALLAQVPGEKIFSVQLADATTAVQGGSLAADQLHFRRLPGEGEFPLANAVRLLRASGALCDVGVEVFSDVLDTLTPAVVGARAGASLRRLLTLTP